MTTGSDVVREARAWIGTPFRHQGRDALGLDCGGLIVIVGQRLGLSSYDVAGYGRRAYVPGFVDHFKRNADEVIPPGDMREGDILIFTDAIDPHHCAILSSKHGARYLIHAHESKRKVWEDPYDHGWPGKLRHVFRYRGLEV